ncbi:hypothetical protein BATDEDRAFT_21202 [Batrachochytrium dendrobatidis JAM81]|uniref:Uncharacterized protein n=1 Tax=Batrachochytrium dendrobatidis (strain JAM81 / FGSC 10211) TaxID=684364 RepID=F4NRN2_BATDJ|nr:uncharacterized protein BATDEDRAFT_21202 [Batrachochytrium dendrobatidis JAM81]EGF82953.1 hypothetical protein BATDEDRAFT_21202 [Batrachochytrium dendrobatidis JAM81]|eukprot:XP_006675227.1 hypothetical protein BATDEDRAFT_21202 [Batrachochytrium dendrobatidis JAM81]
MADSNRRTHKRSPSFDPGIYFSQEDRFPEKTLSFHHQIYEHRYRLYRAYEAAVPKTSPVSDEDDQACFLDFIDTVCIDMRISYGLSMYLLHLYICTTMWSRVFYCVQPFSTDFSTLQHLLQNTTPSSYIASIMSYFLPWKWQLPFLRISCSTRPFMFVDLLDEIQLVYYLAAFISYHFYPALDAWLAIYGMHLINGMLCMAFWFGDPTRSAQWTLSGHANTSTGYFGSWNALYTPLIMWWVYLLGRRNYMGILSWQHMERIEMQKRMHASIDAEISKTSQHEFTKSELHSIFINRLVGATESWVYFIWSYVAPVIVPLLWRCVLRPNVPEVDDLSEKTPWIWTMVLSVMCTFALRLWVSFLSFQMQCVTWFVPYVSGFVINKFEKSVSIGIIY